MLDLLEQTADELKSWFTARGLPGYRADQVHNWLFRRRVDEFAQMTDLPKELRAESPGSRAETLRHSTRSVLLSTLDSRPSTFRSALDGI